MRTNAATLLALILGKNPFVYVGDGDSRCFWCEEGYPSYDAYTNQFMPHHAPDCVYVALQQAGAAARGVTEEQEHAH